MKNSIKTSLLSFLGYFILMAINSCTPETTADEQTDSANAYADLITISKLQFEASGMELTKLQSFEFSDKIAVNGKLDVPPEYKAAISAYYGGYVKKISILPGQQVKKGEILFTMENPDFIMMQQAFLESDGRLAFLKNDYYRQKELFSDKVTSEKEYLKAEANYKAELAKRTSLQKQLALLNINAERLTANNMTSIVAVRSPIKGYITTVKAERGMYLAPKDVAVTVTNSDHIHIELNVYEKDYTKLFVGQEIKFSLQNHPDMLYDANVYLISRSMENDNRVIGVHCHLKDESLEKELIPGMYVEAEILSNKKQKLALTEESIVNKEEQFYVLALSNKSDSSYQFLPVEVRVGEAQNGFMAILNKEAISAYSQFLGKGAFNLINE